MIPPRRLATFVWAGGCLLLAGLGWTPQPPLTAGASRDRWESLAALHAAAREFEASHPGATLRDFAAELTDRAERAAGRD